MEPRIQYAKTADGVSIAYFTMGEGVPFVHLPPAYPFTHVKAEWDIPGWLGWCEQLAGQVKLVRLDMRGCGLSDRDVADRSLRSLQLDVEAVADALQLERFAIAGILHTGPLAIACAAAHPERVSHLILWCTYSEAREAQSPQAEAMRLLLDKDWDVYTETAAHMLFGWSAGEARQFAAVMRESMTQVEAQAAFDAIDRFDVKDLLGEIRCPTMIVHPRGFPMFGSGPAMRMAAEIRGAGFRLLDGTSLAPWRLGDPEAAMRSLGEFMSVGQPVGLEAPTAPVPGAFRTVLFTDLVGHTETMSRLGDARGRAVLREHERITREVLKDHGGTEVKTMGDGFMASFGSVTKAVECAIALQRAFYERNAAVGAPLGAPGGAGGAAPGAGTGTGPSGRTVRAGVDSPLPAHHEPVEGRAEHAPLLVRCGLNAGEPIEEDGDLFGATVIMAARIAAKADGGEILVANAVRELCAGKGFLFADRGDFVAKGFEEPVRVYEVKWQE